MTRAEAVFHIRKNMGARSAAALAKETGLTRGVVHGIMKRRKNQTQKHDFATVEAICAARWTGDRNQIAEQFGTSAGSVSGIWHRYRYLVPAKPDAEPPASPPRPLRLSEVLGIRSAGGLHGISVPRVTILHGEVRP